MNEIKGLLHGFCETGTEGTLPAIQEYEYIKDGCWASEGLYFVDPGDHLTIISPENNETLFSDVIEGYINKINDDGKVFVDEPGFVVKWDRFFFNPKYGQLNINGNDVHYIPTNVDLRLWWDVFFENSGKYNGVLRKNK